MKTRDIFFLVLGALMGIVVVLFIRACSPQRPVAPELAGQAIPRTRFVIDFNKRYNVICSAYQGARSYDDVKIVGYTGAEVRESSGEFSKGYSYFNHWLVIEQRGGTKVYLFMGIVNFLEELEEQRE